MILFLNKCDLFADKIQRVDIKTVKEFSDYSGPSFNYDAGIQYFLDKFVATNVSHEEVRSTV